VVLRLGLALVVLGASGWRGGGGAGWVVGGVVLVGWALIVCVGCCGCKLCGE